MSNFIIPTASSSKQKQVIQDMDISLSDDKSDILSQHSLESKDTKNARHFTKLMNEMQFSKEDFYNKVLPTLSKYYFSSSNSLEDSTFSLSISIKL